MLNKYMWYKTFGCPVKYDDMDTLELDTIMTIHSALNKADEEVTELNKNARGHH